ncbi:hypothetical protein KEH56_24250 [Burkholderia cenocepacia]|uniref:hypothetical protein n=1 Tax=Burkholderia cenocepacia TaxID=95486 RepID=UPI001BA81080|nr:hypothetical protein [Burkholderia cenocepacia]QUN42417.1 hypothetical protein KEH56_24250 [Burkholderia cenocepacia]QUO26182.1 hypothetical protein KEH57_04450 [Burkholderia cenocepacia]
MSKRQPDAAGVLAFLWDHFDATAASDEGLQYLSGAADEASHAALELSSHIAALGGLIERDRGFEGKPQCGELQDADQAALLYRIASELEAISHLAYIGSESNSLLRTRLMEKLETSNFRRIRTAEQSSTLEEV